MGTLVALAGRLRADGVPASADRVAAMLSAVDVLGALELGAVYWAGRLTLCGEPDDLPRYDAAFAEVFGTAQHRPPAETAAPVRQVALTASLVPGAGAPGDRDDLADPDVLGSASALEVLRHRDLAELAETERDALRRLFAELRPAGPMRPSRRRRPAPSGRLDPARTVRRALRAGGEIHRPVRHRARPRPRRVVLLVDVSGSMSPYADALLRYAQAAVHQRPASTEVFTIGTRLTRVTRELRQRDPDRALAAAGTAIPDWSGGTRLGDVLRAFLDRWGQRGTARGAVVVICSDGWERGEPDLLGAQMVRLRRLAHAVVWVNPHKGRPGYLPLTAGIRAALPSVDSFVAGHSMAAFEELGAVLRKDPPARHRSHARGGPQQDGRTVAGRA